MFWRVFGGGATVNPNAWVWRPHCTASLLYQPYFAKSPPSLPPATSVHACVVSNIRACTKVCNTVHRPLNRRVVCTGCEGCCLGGARLLPARLYSCTRLDTAAQIGTDRTPGRGRTAYINQLDPKQYRSPETLRGQRIIRTFTMIV